MSEYNDYVLYVYMDNQFNFIELAPIMDKKLGINCMCNTTQITVQIAMLITYFLP